jgi:uncharacterized protein (TIGR00299 family) protein
MKIAYFDCFAGISGNMILGALVDMGLDIEELKAKLDRLPVEGYRIDATKVAKQGITATHVDVVTRESEDGRALEDITAIIKGSRLDKLVEAKACEIFARLAKAEAKIHGQDSRRKSIRLHEVGATDTIIDVVGGLTGVKMLGIDEVRSSPLNLGTGMVECSHGWLPVPAPITAELLRGVPVYSTDTEGELTTPTGAVMITALASHFGPLPMMRMERVGYGAGRMDLGVPNVLRIFVGETLEEAKDGATEPIALLETNIDDMNPQLYDHVMERLMQAGALDVFLTPVQMKKNRPGTMVSVVARSGDVEKLLDIIFRESTTLGVRVSEMQRRSLVRSSQVTKTKFGRIRVKVAQGSKGVVRMVPEYDDCSKAAKRHNVPISQVYAAVQRVCCERESS